MPSNSDTYNDIALRPMPRVIIVAAMGIIFGFDIASVFLNQSFLTNLYLLVENQSDIIIGSYVLGLVFGNFIAGYITYGSGRKLSIIVSVTVGSLAILASFVAPNFSTLLCAEWVIGFCFGLYLTASALYINEIMLPSYRALSLMFVPCFVLLGTILSAIAFQGIPGKPLISFVIIFIINIVLITLAVFKLPESPRYLAADGSSDAALSVLFNLRQEMSFAARELAEINECCRGETRGIEFFLQNTNYRRLIAFMCIMAFLFNLGGVTILPYIMINNLSATLLCTDQEICFYSTESYVIYLTLIAAFLSVLMFSVSSEKLSRRSVVLTGSAISAIFLLGAALSTMLPDGDMKLWMMSIAFSGYILFAYGSFTVFITVIATEMMPIRAREFGITSVLVSNGIGILFCLQTYEAAIHRFGFTGLLFMCFSSTVIAIYFIYCFLPNTGKQRLEMIESRIISAPSFSRIVTYKNDRTNA